MIDFIKIVQLAIAFSVAYVWIFRFHNVLKEFTSFGLSDVVRNLVGVSKTALSTLLIAGIWYNDLVLVSSVLMGLFMVAAQFFHFKVNNPFQQRLPSLILFILCGIVVFFQFNTFK
ncbi:MAG: hypothetical protein CMP63_01555 [Flavobacteriales bacterium]|nr:hypothetical protein [Flavobacteriales bacterium]|tara:strand:- start:252 stop:599 length:348 start_codon:yes stop_codon:yes gene_type:complete